MSTDAALASNGPLPLSMTGLVKEMRAIHDHTSHQSFVFLLGAGASVSSGIPAAARLAKNWLEDLHFQDPSAADVPFDKWLAAGRHGIQDLDPNNLAASYPAIYDRRFSTNPDHGYAALTKVMSNAEPGLGYSVLATMLATQRHNTVITTNFDNLIERALLYYTNHTPLTCTHETTAGAFSRGVSRPLIVKCHRDLLLDPHSGQDGTKSLNDKYGAAIRSLLPGKVLIVVGYGGNDGSLMDFFEKLDEDHCSRAVYWCYWKPDGPPTGRAAAWIAKRRGAIVPIDGFDELFYAVRKEFGFPLLDDEMDSLHGKRKAAYRLQAEDIAKRMGEGDAPSPAGTAAEVSATIPGVVGSNAGSVDDKIECSAKDSPRASTNLAIHLDPLAADGDNTVSSWEALLPILEMPAGPDKCAAFEALIKEYPSDPEVLDRYATALREHGQIAEAAKHAAAALALAEFRVPNDSPELSRFLNNLATIQQAQGDLTGARASMARAITIDEKHLTPDHPTFATRYSNLAMIQMEQGDLSSAQVSIERAIAIQAKHFAPDHPAFATSFSNLAMIQKAQGNVQGARSNMERAISIDIKHFGPNHPTFATRYSNLSGLQRAQGDLTGARASMQQAIAIGERHLSTDDPLLATYFSNLAMIQHAQGDLPGARANMERAIAIKLKQFDADSPRLAISYNNLALIAVDEGKIPEAVALWRKAHAIYVKALGPDHKNTTSVAAALRHFDPTWP